MKCVQCGLIMPDNALTWVCRYDLTSWKNKIDSLQCDRMPFQLQRMSGAPHSCHGAAGSGHNYLCASVHHDLLSRDARQVEKSPPPQALLARGHASPLPRAGNYGKTGALDAKLDPRLAFASCAQGRLLEYPAAGRLVGPKGPACLALTHRWHALSRAMAVGNRNGARSIPWPKKGAKANISHRFSVSVSSC